MVKRSLSILLSAALATGVFSALPAKAQEAPAVPAEPNIVDPAGDANYINNNNTAGQSGNNHVTGPDASSLADILAVWLTNDAEKISIHVQTEAPQPSSGAAYIVFFRANADDCLLAEFAIAAPSYQGDSYAEVEDTCAGLDPADGEVVSVEGPDGTGIITATFPRAYSASFADGAVIATPRIEMRNLTGGPVSLRGPTIDNTDPGSDYTIVGGGSGAKPEPEPTEEPPGKSDPPGKGKKKGCKKGKGKKKGACPEKPKPPVAECPAYVPGEEGAEAETTVVTDAATEEKPIVAEFDAGPGMGSAGPYNETTSVFQNVQVDTANADTGLYAKLEFQNFHDYDLYLNYADGSTAANSGDFNAAAGHGLGSGSPDGAWEAGTNYEMVMGIRTADCAGYTARMVSWLTNGGAMTLSLWLGDVVADPNAPEGEEALQMFYGLLGATR
ncbi:MAG: hypothetical protein M3277_01455 [Actinomycetota bacterium]|nr:hypothetical protein [Actinomycetota bacterium]